MTRPFFHAREQARVKNALLHRGKGGKLNSKGKELIKNAKAKAIAEAKSASLKTRAASRGRRGSIPQIHAQTHGIPAMPRTNMIPV